MHYYLFFNDELMSYSGGSSRIRLILSGSDSPVHTKRVVWSQMFATGLNNMKLLHSLGKFRSIHPSIHQHHSTILNDGWTLSVLLRFANVVFLVQQPKDTISPICYKFIVNIYLIQFLHLNSGIISYKMQKFFYDVFVQFDFLIKSWERGETD